MVVFHIFKIVQMVPNRATNTYIFTKKLLNENKDFEWKLFFRMNTSFLNKKNNFGWNFEIIENEIIMNIETNE